MAKQAAITPTTLKPSSRAELERKRKGVLATAPSGAVYRLRSMDLTRHALAGGLPAHLIQLGLAGKEGLKRVFEEMAEAEGAEDEVLERYAGVREYMDKIVLASVMEPELKEADLGDPAKLDSNSLVPGMDYQWIVAVGLREEDYDAQGRRLWGLEPLSKFQLFRHFHDCTEDCPGCLGLSVGLSAVEGLE